MRIIVIIIAMICFVAFAAIPFLLEKPKKNRVRS